MIKIWYKKLCNSQICKCIVENLAPNCLSLAQECHYTKNATRPHSNCCQMKRRLRNLCDRKVTYLMRLFKAGIHKRMWRHRAWWRSISKVWHWSSQCVTHGWSYFTCWCCWNCCWCSCWCCRWFCCCSCWCCSCCWCCCWISDSLTWCPCLTSLKYRQRLIKATILIYAFPTPLSQPQRRKKNLSLNFKTCCIHRKNRSFMHDAMHDGNQPPDRQASEH